MEALLLYRKLQTTIGELNSITVAMGHGTKTLAQVKAEAKPLVDSLKVDLDAIE